MATTSVRSAAPAEALARSRSRKKRFLLVSIAALAVMAATMGVSFLDQSGSTALSVSAGAGTSLVWTPGSTSFTLPVGDGTKPLTTTKYATTITTNATTGSSATSGVVTSVAPSWSPTANSPGSVATGGDLAVIDATRASGPVIVNLYVTNLASLAKDYSSFAFPIDIYWSDGNATPSAASTWTPADGTSSGPNVVTQSPFSSFLTDTTGEISFSLPAGHYYDITLEGSSGAGAGGSFYCISTTDTSALSPSFFVTANPTT